jgi:tRNA1Val (adenine37-N6)-methyltransferase
MARSFQAVCMATAEPEDSQRVELFDGRLSLYQPARGYRFSIDAVLLADFAAPRAAGVVVDLGTGSGILPVILARTSACASITGVEVQPGLADLARHNVSLNRCQDRATVIQADIRDLRRYFTAEGCDTVITNPPFYRAGAGRVNPDSASAIARHELCGTLQDFVAAAAYLLRQGGRFCAVYQPARIVDMLAELRRRAIEPKTIRFVHSRTGEAAVMVLIEGIKSAGVEAKILPPLVLYDEENRYTRDVQAIFAAV